MSNYNINKFHSCDIISQEVAHITSLLNTNNLETYDINKLLNFSEQSNIKIIKALINKIVAVPIPTNYKLSFYEPLLKLIFNVLLKHTKSSLIINKLLETHFLDVLTMHLNGIKYLNLIESNIKENIKIVKKTSIVNILGNKGNLPTFIFWKKIFNFEILNEESLGIFEKSIKNSDDRIFKWFLTEMKKGLGVTYFLKSHNIETLLHNILISQTPAKFVLKKIKVLSEHINLIPYLNYMIKFTHVNDITFQLLKYYYKTPLTNESINELSTSFEDSNSKNIFDMLKTEEEKDLLLVYKLTSNLHQHINDFKIVSMCTGNIIPFKQANIDYTHLQKNLTTIVSNINYIINSLEIETLSDLFDNINCACGHNCFGNLVSELSKLNCFHQIKHINVPNVYTSINFLSTPIQLLTKFIIPSITNIVNNPKFYIKSLSINKVLTFLRVIAKKRAKSKIINFKVKFYPLMNELLNFKPTNKPVLRNGSINWQYQKQKFTNMPPRHLLPYEINIYDNFLIREKADGILINNLPLSIYPKNDDIFMRQLKAEYIEDLEVYLVFDIDLPNTNIVNRYEFLRNNHPYTRNTSLKLISNINEFMNELKEERLLFKKFINENNKHKIRWYPKVSFLVENATEEFKEEIIMEMVENKDSEFCTFINKNGDYTCDGIIISPLGQRDIKIKPKDLMTIDLLYDSNNNWVDKEKINYNKLINVNITVKQNKIYRCYPNNNLYEPREVRFDKKYPNSSDIINQILSICKFDWKNKNYILENPYYHLKKTTLNKVYINQLEKQSSMLQNQLDKMLPENGKTWLDLGCGKGKLVSHIKKYNPKKYLGIDIDVDVLLKTIHLIDEQDWIKFTPCNLREDWNDSKWFSLKNLKFDYIVLNFSMMHLFSSDKFWTQLKNMCSKNTKILFNVVSENIIGHSYTYHDAYMKYNEGKINYYFPWSHSHEVSEEFISQYKLEEKVTKYGFTFNSFYNEKDLSNKSLVSKYDWYIMTTVLCQI